MRQVYLLIARPTQRRYLYRNTAHTHRHTLAEAIKQYHHHLTTIGAPANGAICHYTITLVNNTWLMHLIWYRHTHIRTHICTYTARHSPISHANLHYSFSISPLQSPQIIAVGKSSKWFSYRPSMRLSPYLTVTRHFMVDCKATSTLTFTIIAPQQVV